MTRKLIKIGLFGAGYFGNLHARNLHKSQFEFIGFYDPDDQRSSDFEAEHSIKRFEDAETLIRSVDAVDIVSPTISHVEIGLLAAKYNRHIFIEKPIAASAEEAEDFIRILNGDKSIVQVGHIERFNPAFKNGILKSLKAKNIVAERLAEYNPRADDISVVHDLMIHDIDAILSIVKSEITSIHATGISLLTDHLDFCEARIEFKNKCIANLTASRMHVGPKREMRIQGMKQHITIDYLNKSCRVFNLEKKLNKSIVENQIWKTPKGTFQACEKVINYQSSNAILEELEEFYNSIVFGDPVRVSHEDAFKALFVADKIQEIACSAR